MDDKVVITKKVSNFFKKGEVIFREGDKGSEMYIIQSGKVEVVRKSVKEEVLLATIEPKAFFGEMALFGDPHRSATIKAVEDTKMIVITKEILDSQLKKVPEWFVSIMKSLIEKLKETNKRIKTRFGIGVEFSILKVLYFLAKFSGETSDEGITLNLNDAREECCNLLAISKEQFDDIMKTLMFVRLVKFSEQKNLLLIPDSNKLKNFMDFLKNKSIEGEKDKELETLPDSDEQNIMFEKIYKLFHH